MRAKSLCAAAAGLALLAAAGGCSRRSYGTREAMLWTGGDPQQGRDVIRYYGCNTCHDIDGVPGARGRVGPPLNGIRERSYIAGVLPNNPQNLMRWIQHPRAVVPHTAMPEMSVTEGDSRDIAAYLYTLQ